MKKLLPLILLILGSGAGVGAGIFLRPSVEAAAPQPAAETLSEETEPASSPEPAEAETVEYVKLNNQFVVPIVKNRKVAALMVMSLSVEVQAGMKEFVFQREPKLRDAFLQVLFDHANMGGFEGAFTDANNLAVLRAALREIGQKILGKDVAHDVLILEIARQDY